jgi:hypothetical protein
MCSAGTMNPTGGVTWRRGIERSDPSDPLRFVKELLGGTERPAMARHALGTARCACPPLEGTRTPGGVGLLLPISIIADPPESSLHSDLRAASILSIG